MGANLKGVVCLALLLGAELLINGCSKKPPTPPQKDPWEEGTQVSGGSVSFEPILEEASDILKGNPGVKDITLNLDKDKINKVAQRRDAKLKDYYPEVFGINKEFKPLLVILAKGPGIVTITSPTIGSLAIKLKNQCGRFMVYPDFKIENLFRGTSNEEETVQIEFTDLENKKVLVDRFPVKWSGPNEILVNDDEINDIASIVSNQIRGRAARSPNIATWLKKEAEIMAERNIRYIPSKNATTGWQRINPTKDIIKTGEASCLEAATLIALDAMEAGLKAYIVTASGHAFLGVSKRGENISNAMFIDPILFLNQSNGMKLDIEGGLDAGRAAVEAELVKNKEKVLAIDLEEIEKLYRNTQK